MLRKRTLNVALLLVVGIGTLAFGLARSAPVAGQDDADVAAKIENAMSAAPAAIADTRRSWITSSMTMASSSCCAKAATAGPVFPTTPGHRVTDPWCFDQTWLDWTYAFFAGEEPTVTVPGFAYMLQGGSDASNTDPFATEPAAGEEWVSSPPHIMLLLPEDLDQTVFSTDHHSGGALHHVGGTPPTSTS